MAGLVTQRLRRCDECGFLLPAPHRPDGESATGSCALPVAPGTILRGRYRLIDLLGRGAHGLTFLARHEFLDHPCVVKMLPYPMDDASDLAVRRLRNEASAGFLVSSPNVVRVFDCDTYDGTWYLVSEYVEGCDLSAVTAAGLRMPWRQVVRAALDATRGLAAIHAAGLVHRDIKPGNLMLGADGRLRVADLGVVGFMHRRGDEHDRADAGRVGTPAYAAPEALAGRSVSAAADLYSLGASLFELLTGEPHRGRSLFRALLDNGTADVEWPARAEACPDWLRDAVLRLLRPIPGERLRSAEELTDLIEQHGTSAAARTGAARSPEPPRGVAIPVFENRGTSEDDGWLGHTLADHLSRAWLSAGAGYLASREEFHATLERVRQRRGSEGPAGLLEAARLTGAALVAQGWYARRGADVELGLRIHGRLADAFDLPALRGPLERLPELEASLWEAMRERLGLEGQAARTTAAVPLEAEERLVRAKSMFLRGSYEEAAVLAEDALRLAPEFAEALSLAGAAYARLARYEPAEACHERLRAFAQRTGDGRLAVEALSNLGTMHYFKGDYPAAVRILGEAVDRAAALALASEAALIRNNLGFVLLKLGQTQEAEAMFASAIETHRRNGALVALIGPYNGTGHVLREQGRLDEARERFQRALALAQESDDFVNVGIAYMNLGHCALLQGRHAEAKHELAVALNLLERTRFWNGLARVYEHVADLHTRRGSFEEAARCAELRLELAERTGNEGMRRAAAEQLEQARAEAHQQRRLEEREGVAAGSGGER